MPPPPPPSKSYLLVIDTDSEEEEEKVAALDEETTPFTVLRNDVRSFLQQSGIRPRIVEDLPEEKCDKEEDEDDDDDDDDEEKEGDAAVQAKKRKRKKKKKKKKKSPPTTVDQIRKQVRFGHISIREYSRCLGEQVVTSDGSWPLGLSETMTLDLPGVLTVDEYELEKQTDLQSRWSQLPPELRGEQAQETLETRQWDYKRKCKNPLFHILTEKDRMHILLADSAPSHDTTSPAPAVSSKRSKGRSRSGSVSEGNVARTRSGSISEMCNDVYTPAEVLHIRNELEKIRNSRTMEGHLGCTCRKLHVYLLPPEGGGKKAHHRRMNPHKLKEELRKRHLLPNQSKTREELELLLHDAVENEPCCTSDCPCSQDGIECQADACSCWLSSHQSQKAKDDYASNAISVEAIRERCGNKYGMYAVDLNKINQYRSGYYCQEIAA